MADGDTLGEAWLAASGVLALGDGFDEASGSTFVADVFCIRSTTSSSSCLMRSCTVATGQTGCALPSRSAWGLGLYAQDKPSPLCVQVAHGCCRSQRSLRRVSVRRNETKCGWAGWAKRGANEARCVSHTGGLTFSCGRDCRIAELCPFGDWMAAALSQWRFCLAPIPGAASRRRRRAQTCLSTLRREVLVRFSRSLPTARG